MFVNLSVFLSKIYINLLTICNFTSISVFVHPLKMTPGFAPAKSRWSMGNGTLVIQYSPFVPVGEWWIIGWDHTYWLFNTPKPKSMDGWWMMGGKNGKWKMEPMINGKWNTGYTILSFCSSGWVMDNRMGSYLLIVQHS